MDENEVIARRFFDELWTGGRLYVADELLSDGHLHHISGDVMQGTEAVKDLVQMLRTGFPDLRFEIEDVVSRDDKVLVRWTAHGTHDGELGGAAPTGRQVRWTGMDLIRFQEGRIVELWGNNDSLGLWEQLES